jgi:hypothetical protein
VGTYGIDPRLIWAGGCVAEVPNAGSETVPNESFDL